MQLLSENELNKNPTMLKVTEAAKLLNCTRQHLYILIREGKLPHLFVGGTIRIPRDQLFKVLIQYTESR